MYRALLEILSSSAAPRTLAVCTAHYYSGQLWCQWVWRGNGWTVAPWMSSRLEPHVDRDATPQYTRLFVARSALHSFGLSQLLRMCRPRRAPLGNWNSRFKAVEIVLVVNSYAWLFASEHSPTRTRMRYIKYGYRTCDYVRTFQNVPCIRLSYGFDDFLHFWTHPSNPAHDDNQCCSLYCFPEFHENPPA